MTLIALLSILCCLSATPADARGRPEAAVAAAEARVLLLYPLGREPEALVRERLDLPSSAATLFWSTYRVEGGRVQIERSGSYSLPRLVSREEGGPWALYAYRVTMVPPEAGGRKIDVPFTADQAQAGGLQPAPFAVQEGIRAGGAASGSVRLVEIVHAGAGRFRATVEVR